MFGIDDPLAVWAMTGAGGYVAWLYLQDLRAARAGRPHPRAFPGAVPCRPGVVVLAAAGAGVLLALATLGEHWLGTSGEQSRLPFLALPALLAAAVIEEVVFRGYLLVDHRGTVWRWGSAIGFSLLFAALHVQYYLTWEEGAAWWQPRGNFGLHATWTLLCLFANSLWFYAVRLLSGNPGRSLLPCFAAHASLNLGVFLVKLAQGHIGS